MVDQQEIFLYEMDEYEDTIKNHNHLIYGMNNLTIRITFR